jgi:hypothetical protein
MSAASGERRCIFMRHHLFMLLNSLFIVSPVEYNHNMISDAQRMHLYQRAAECYRAQDRIGWQFAVLAACSDGTYQDLAAYIGGVSADKVESSAHAWGMYRALRREYGGVVGAIRRLDYVYLSHFLALHRIQRKYGVGLDVLWSYLQDVYQAEGGVSSRDLMLQAEREHGTEKALPYEAARAEKALRALLTRGDLATPDRKLFVQALERLEALRG